MLRDALDEALREVKPALVKKQIAEYVPADAQQILAGSGIRDEHVFPVPAVLEAQPTLLGYYRLLLGVSQKTFYGTGTGAGRFKTMESHGRLAERQKDGLADLCGGMAEALAILVRELSPTITRRDVDELPLLTLGSQFQGANNVAIGQQAIIDVFLAISEIVEDHIESRDNQGLVVLNAAGRRVQIILAADPDVRIQEEFGETLHNKVAIEVKGGTDSSNAHNRLARPRSRTRRPGERGSGISGRSSPSRGSRRRSSPQNPRRRTLGSTRRRCSGVRDRTGMTFAAA